MNYTESDFIHVDLSGDANTMKCLICGVVQDLPQSDDLVPYGVDSGRGALRIIKTSKQHLDVFKKKHLALHFEKYQTGKKKTVARRDGMRKRFDSKTGLEIWA